MTNEVALINLSEVSLAYGGLPLLDQVGYRVRAGERVCLLGRNGAGKSSLLRLLAGRVEPDAGQITRAPGLVTGYLPQDVPPDLGGPVYQVAALGMGPAGQALWALRQGRHPDDGLPEGLTQEELWRLDNHLQTVLTRLGLDPDAPAQTLSGGLKRRTLLARALAADPDLLLLDEPTNHLDLNTIVWLEDFLQNSWRRSGQKSGGAMVFVSHDRAFARNLATRVTELDRGAIHDWNCPYDQFVALREQALAVEQEQRDRQDRKLAQEELWLSGGLKARRTRNEGRVRRVMAMRAEQAARRQVLGSAQMAIQTGGISGKVVAEAQGVTFGYGPDPLLRDFSTLILRGDKVGIMGPNGAGKTTLLGLLLGRLTPQAGTLKLGANLAVAYFDQMRQELDPERTVQENLADGQDTILVGDHQRHVISYLKDFLFTPDRAHSPVKVLSGGERNRLLLAKLFARPANLLVLDEPTNDLDRDTLELLENLLVEFEGTVLVVSHDRQFLNNVVASTLVLEGDGRVGQYAGGYDDWLTQRPAPAAGAPAKAAKPAKPKPTTRQRKLTFNEKRELAELPGRLAALEEEQERLQEQVADPALYATQGDKVASLTARLTELEALMDQAFTRWQELEDLAAGEAGE